jgi:hypothetical protein
MGRTFNTLKFLVKEPCEYYLNLDTGTGGSLLSSTHCHTLTHLFDRRASNKLFCFLSNSPKFGWTQISQDDDRRSSFSC